MNRVLLLIGALLATAVAIACHWPLAGQNRGISLTARPWLAADRLFRQDPRWLGADDAHSVDLGSGRVLWLFGDTFIDPSCSGDRSRADLIRNSIGIQTGSEPASAAMAFFWWQAAAGVPASFFPESDKTWYWPGDGIRIENQLLIFLTMIEPAANDLGFAVSGWQAVIVVNPDAPPGRWSTIDAKKDPSRFPVVLGTGSVLRHKGYLYAYGSNFSGDQAYLARWPEKKAGAGDLRDLQWWCGSGPGWKTERQMDSTPEALFTDAQSEFGVYHDARIDRFVQIQAIGFGAADLGFRTAPRPQGPWAALTPFYEPQEKKIPGVLVYAAKPHRFIIGAGLAVTYATNHIDPNKLLGDSVLYYPKVLQVSVESTDVVN